LQPIQVETRYLGRRSIGRNIAAKHSTADIVWFSDVDQVYYKGCLDRLAELKWAEDTSMVFPKEIMIHRDWETGDQAAAVVASPRLVDIDPAEFIPKRYGRAIGGVQIVRGDFARCFGYLPDSEKYQKPVDGMFGDFRDDIVYRSFCKRKAKMRGVDLPGMFRIRHTQTTYQ